MEGDVRRVETFLVFGPSGPRLRSNPDTRTRMAELDLSIIIVSWNTSGILGQCLTSILSERKRSPHLRIETWVVDNASTDDSTAMVQQRFPWTRLIANRENIGFARANNQALRQCLGRTVLLLNPDTEVLPGAIPTLMEFLQKQSDAGVVGPLIVNPDLTFQSSCNPMPTLGREFWRLMGLDSLLPLSIYREGDWDLTGAHKVEVVQGNCLLMRREVIFELGLFDERYFMFTEEVDLCYRFLQRGWSVYWLPTARIVHYGGQSTRLVAREMFLELYRSKLLFFRKTQGRWGGLVYKLILLLTALSRITLGLMKTEPLPQARQRAGLYLGLVRELPSL